jgi:hypothetical protein
MFSGLQIHAVEKVCEAQVGAHRIENRVRFYESVT